MHPKRICRRAARCRAQVPFLNQQEESNAPPSPRPSCACRCAVQLPFVDQGDPDPELENDPLGLKQVGGADRAPPHPCTAPPGHAGALHHPRTAPPRACFDLAGLCLLAGASCSARRWHSCCPDPAAKASWHCRPLALLPAAWQGLWLWQEEEGREMRLARNECVHACECHLAHAACRPLCHPSDPLSHVRSSCRLPDFPLPTFLPSLSALPPAPIFNTLPVNPSWLTSVIITVTRAIS